MYSISLAIAISFAAACSHEAKRIPEVPRPPSHHLSGRVLHRTGIPAAGSVLVATDPATSDPVATTRTDARGHFEFTSRVSRVALTATTTQEATFLPIVDIEHGSLDVLLEAGCALVHGHVDFGAPTAHAASNILRFVRFSEAVGDVFGVHIEPDGNFEACVPRAQYLIKFPEGFVSQRILTSVPPPAALTIRAISRNLADTSPPGPLTITADDEHTFLQDAQTSTRLISLAESNHGTRDFILEQTRLSIELARQYQFTLILLETGYGETLALDDYVNGVDVDVRAAVKKLDYWTWDTKSFIDSLAEIRQYNQTVRTEQRVRILGADIQSTRGAVDDLLMQHLTTSSHEEIRLLELLREKSGQKWRAFTTQERSVTRRFLESLAIQHDGGGLGSIVNRHALAARSLLLQLDYLEATNSGEESRIRDKSIATMAREALTLDPHVRATLWAHMGHLVREYIVGAPPAGAYLAEWLGTGYRVFVFLAYSGTSRARDPSRKGDIIPHRLPASPGRSLEGALAASGHGLAQAITYWSFDRAKGTTRQWLHGLHWVRSFGAIYPGDQASFDLYDLSALDGAILFKDVSPSEPNKD